MSEVFGSPIRLLIGIYILWSFIGPACFVGVLTAFILIPINVIIEYCTSHFQKNADEKKHELIETLSECLRGMKVLKMYAWEEFFLEKFIKLRKFQIGKLRKASVLKMSFKFLYLSSTSIISLATISAYVIMEKSISVKTIFVSYFIIYLLKTPFQTLLHLFAFFVQGIASMKRVQHFLETKELDSIKSLDDIYESTVILKNASYSWSGFRGFCLKNLTTRILEKSLIAVVGETGCGKSSLLQALVGEMQKLEGEVTVKGPIALVTQKSWIQNMTVQKNILFLKNKDNEFYQKTLEACALTMDIESLPAGDETEIGKKGIHLSETQKLKINMARAVYQDANLYIFDDPLQNLDTLLAEHLYHRVIGRSGLLKNKTRLFLTQSEDYLPLVDFVLFMKDGRIIEQGTYTQLTEKNGHLSEYLKNRKLYPHPTTEPKIQNTTENLEDESSSLGKLHDVWCSAAIVPAKVKIESSITNETPISSKELGTKLGEYLKITGIIFTITVLAVVALASLCEVLGGVWLTKWADGHVESSTHDHTLLIYSGIISCQIFLTVTSGIAIFAASTMTAEKLHLWLLQQIMRASQMVFETTPAQKFINSFDIDFQFIDERIPETVYVWLFAVLKIPSFLVIIFIASPMLAVALIPAVYLFLLIQHYYVASSQQLQHLTAATSCPMRNLTDDLLQGITHIRASHASSHFANRFHAKLDTHNNCSFLFLVVSRWASCILDLATALLVLATTIAAFHEQQQGNTFIALSIIFSIQLGETLTNLVYTSSLLNSDLTPFERIVSFSSIKQESEWEDPANKPPVTWPDTGSVIVQNLSTAYGEGMYPVIHNINFSVEPGEKIAIIGKEESGIYTFLYSIFRFIEPIEGCINIDSIDIHKLGLRDLRSKLAIIPQESIVFKGTIRHNLDPGRIYTDQELRASLNVINTKYGASFTDLDSNVDNQISVEEKYLLSIARCLLKKPKILFIDEQEPPDSTGRSLFQESTILSFSEHPIIDHNGRTINFMSGEIVSSEFCGES